MTLQSDGDQRIKKIVKGTAGCALASKGKKKHLLNGIQTSIREQCGMRWGLL